VVEGAELEEGTMTTTSKDKRRHFDAMPKDQLVEILVRVMTDRDIMLSIAESNKQKAKEFPSDSRYYRGRASAYQQAANWLTSDFKYGA
jgi:hypothetical protein